MPAYPDLPGRAVQGAHWTPSQARTIAADFARFQASWRRLDVALTTGPAPASAAATEVTDQLGAFAHDQAASFLRVAVDHLETWRRVYDGNFRPTYAHFSLIRTAHESSWSAYWLMEPGAAAATRLERGVAAACDDFDERRKVEDGMGLTSATPPAKLAADRLADVMASAAARGLTKLNRGQKAILITPMPSIVNLFDLFEPHPSGRGSNLYRLLSGFAHGKQYAATQGVKRAGPIAGSGHVLGVVTADPLRAVACTQKAVDAFEKAIDAFISYRV